MSDNGPLLLRASAGTGKTYRLVEAYVEEIRDHGRQPSEIVAITFTRKAAGELRSKIRQRLKKEGFDKSILADLAQAPIGNFHGLSLQLLRNFGLTGGMREGISVLGEDGDADVVFLEACEDAWFAGEAITAKAIERVSPHLSTDNKLPEALLKAIDMAREDGRTVDGAALLGEYDPKALRAPLHGRLLALRQHLADVASSATAKGQALIEQFLAAPIPADDASHEAWAEAWSAAGSGLNRVSLKKQLEEDDLRLLKAGKGKPAAVMQVVAEAVCADLVAPLAVLIDAAWSAYGAAKRVRRASDFGDLVGDLVDLLSDREALHRSLRQRIRSVLVDEAQDTNRLQRRMVRLLAGYEGPAAGDSEPARLFVVGDRKQCIYTFRGADPGSFEAFTADVLEHGGSEENLEASWRSGPELVEAINSLGDTMFGDGYDALLPNPDPADGRGPLGRPAMTWLELPEEKLSGVAGGAREAAALAAWIYAQQQAGVPAGDFALLLSSMTRAPLFLSALANLGIPAVLGGGGGFYQQSEICDVISLLGWITDATERMAAAVALRSPIVGLSDSGLMALFVRRDGADPLLSLRRGSLDGIEGLGEADTAVLQQISARLPEQIRAGEVMLAAEMLELLDRTFDLRAVYLAFEAGEQRLANLDRLFELARSFDASGRGGVARFAREQVDNMRLGHKEPLSPVPAAARRAVTISTIHQSKGLQYPVVLLADLRNQGKTDTEPLRYEQQAGIVFKPALRGNSLESRRWIAASERMSDERQAEQRRLLYVAVTRAQREVLFIGTADAKSKRVGFAKLLDPWRDGAEAAGVLVRQPAPAPVSLEVPPEAPKSMADEKAAAERLLKSAASISTPMGARFALPVTSLETYLTCSRRGFLVHDLQVPEPGFPDARLRWSADEDRDPPLDPLARGRLAHEVLAALERCASLEEAETFVDAELSLGGYDPGDHRLEDLRKDVLAFLGSDLGRQLLELGAENRRPELPFQLALQAGDYVAVLHGQIDLLYWHGEAPVVVDYKHARAGKAGLERYKTQLETYALAVERLCGVDGDIQTRLVFLRDRAGPREYIVTPQMRRDLEARLTGVVEILAQLRGRNLPWPGQPQSTCDALGCGFLRRCHGESPS